MANPPQRAPLPPLGHVQRRTEMLVRPMSQVQLRLTGGYDSFERARKSCLQWIERKAGQLPPEAWAGRTFALDDLGSQRAEAIHIEDPMYWGARTDDADRDVPSRHWIAEIGLGMADADTVLFGARLTVVSRGALAVPERTIPTFVRHVLNDSNALLDGKSIPRAARIIEDETDVDELVELIENPLRQHDVIVISLPENSTDPSQTACSADSIFRRVRGAAHVAIITGPACTGARL